MKPFTLYALSGPDEVIRYVGITCQPLHGRLSRHLRPLANCEKDHRACWILKLIREGAPPTISALAVNLSKDEACCLEIQTIAALREIGWPLVNTSDGGDAPWFGKKLSPQHVQNIRASLKGKTKPEEHRRKIGAARIGKARPPFSQSWRANIQRANRARDKAQVSAALSAALRGKKKSKEAIANALAGRKAKARERERNFGQQEIPTCVG